jgi:hypothetical protein
VAGTTVVVLDTAPVVSPPETLPIDVPEKVKIQGQLTVVRAPTGPSAVVRLGAPGSSLDNLVIDGSKAVDGGWMAGDVTSGIEVVQASDASTRITNVRVQYMSEQGILVSAGAVLALGTGLHSLFNGPPIPPGPPGPPGVPPADGLVVYGTATLHVDNGGLAAEFNHNIHYGIWAKGSRSLTVTGSANPVAYATHNHHGLSITQTPAGADAGAAPLNTITSLVVDGSTGHGILVTAGSSLKLRDSESRANAQNGISSRSRWAPRATT